MNSPVAGALAAALEVPSSHVNPHVVSVPAGVALPDGVPETNHPTLCARSVPTANVAVVPVVTGFEIPCGMSDRTLGAADSPGYGIVEDCSAKRIPEPRSQRTSVTIRL